MYIEICNKNVDNILNSFLSSHYNRSLVAVLDMQYVIIVGNSCIINNWIITLPYGLGKLRMISNM